MEFYGGMVCPICESGKLQEKAESIEFEYKNEKRIIPDRKLFRCERCEEAFLNSKDERKLERLLTDVRRRIDGLLTSKEIKEIRKQFGMTQVEFAKALRVGEKNFARYESGQASQSNAMDNLLRILKKFPYAIRTIYKDWPVYQSKTIIEFKAFLPKAKKKREVIVRKPTNCGINEEGYADANSI